MILGGMDTVQKYFSRVVLALILAGVFMVHPVSAKTASEVVNKETLKSFVMNAKDRLERAETLSEFFSTLREFREGKTWKDGSIYLVIMQRPSGPQGGEVVVFNAHNPALEGTTLHVTDVDDRDIGHEIDKAVYKGDGFVEYRWDNPSIVGDEVSGKGRASGTSLKVFYGVNVKLFGEDLVLGSGFYPDSSSAGDSHSHKKGCALVAPGAENSSKSSVFSLVMIVSAMLLAASIKNRS